MKLKTIFRGYERGEPCIGAIHAYGLQTSELAARGVIHLVGNQWHYGAKKQRVVR